MHIINSTKSYRRFHCTYKSRCECSFYCAAMDSFASMLIYNLDVHDDNYIGNSYFLFSFFVESRTIIVANEDFLFFNIYLKCNIIIKYLKRKELYSCNLYLYVKLLHIAYKVGK